MGAEADLELERDDDRDDEDAPEHLWESREVRWSALSGLLLAAGFAADRLDASAGLVTVVYLASALAGLRFFAVEAAEELWREREVGIELLMTVATLAAGLLGEWGEAATLAFLYSISEALEEFTEDRTRGAIRALMDLAPKRVSRLRGGVEEEIDVADLAVGDRFLVRPGQSVATDGTVEEGRSAINEAAVTGESIPVEKAPGDKVFAGTLNTSGALVVVATATTVTNTLAKIVHLVTEAQEEKGRGEQFMQRFARRYSPAVLVSGAAVAVVGGGADRRLVDLGGTSRHRHRRRRPLRPGHLHPGHLRGRHRQRQPKRVYSSREASTSRSWPSCGYWPSTRRAPPLARHRRRRGAALRAPAGPGRRRLRPAGERRRAAG